MRLAVFYIIFFITTACVFSCHKEKELTVNATVINLTGRLDGCGYLLQLDNGSYMEPVKLPAGVQLLEGRRVSVRYTTVSRISICMAGPTIEISALRYL